MAWLLAPACLALAGLHLLAARRFAVGAFNDDAFFILLSKSLRTGAFALADGAAVTDPLPGFAALLLIPSWLVEPRWHLLQPMIVAFALLSVWLTWRLALRFLSPGWALAAALVVALNPVLVGLDGLVIADIPYLALSLALFLGAAALAPGSPAWALPALSLAAALGCLTRPQGSILGLSLGMAVWLRLGWGRGLAFLAGAFLPLAGWMLRNLLAGDTVTGFVANWKSQSFLFADPLQQAGHVLGLLGALFGQGLAGVTGPEALSAAAGLGCLALVAHGSVRLARGSEGVPAAAMATYVIFVLAMHSTWPLKEARYLIALLPFVVILIMASLRIWLERRPLAAGLLLLAFSAALLRHDLGFAARGLGPRPAFEPETMAWLAENLPAEARVESLAFHTVELFTGRRTVPPGLTVYDRHAWLASALARGVTHLHVSRGLLSGEFAYPSLPYLKLPTLESWARQTPYASELYANPREGTAVFRIHHPAPGRYFEAYTACLHARDPASGASSKILRRRLKAALELEPSLACALSAEEPGP